MKLIKIHILFSLLHPLWQALKIVFLHCKLIVHMCDDQKESTDGKGLKGKRDNIWGKLENKCYTIQFQFQKKEVNKKNCHKSKREEESMLKKILISSVQE